MTQNATIPSSFVRDEWYARAYAYFLVFLFLVPTFNGLLRVGGGTYFGQIIQVGYAAATFALMVLWMRHRQLTPLQLFVPTILACVFFGLIVLAILRDVDRTVASDFLELHKPVYALIIFLASVIIPWEDRLVRHVSRAYMTIVALIAIYSLFEAFGGEFARSVSGILYRSDRAILAGKATGPFGVTYFLAAFMTFGVALSFAAFAYLRKARYLVLGVLSLAAVVLSQSRSGVIALVAMVVCVYLLYGFYSDFRGKLRVYVIGLLILGTLAFSLERALHAFEGLPYLYEGLTRLLERGIDPEGGGSFNERYRQLLFAIESQDAIPIVGVGIGKGYARLLESYYALYLYRYGGLGIILSIVIFLLFFFSALKAFRTALRNGERYNAAFFLALHVWMYAFPIASLSSVIHDQAKFAVFFYGSLGILISYNRVHRRRQPSGAERAAEIVRPESIGRAVKPTDLQMGNGPPVPAS